MMNFRILQDIGSSLLILIRNTIGRSPHGIKLLLEK